MADRRVTVTLDANIARYKAQLAEAAAATKAFGSSTNSTGKEIDKLSGRLRLMADIAVMGAPALTAFGAAGVGAMVAIAAQAGALAGALGVTVLAFNGVGDALKALDTYQLDPTAAHLKAMRIQMEKLGPSGENFVRFLDEIEPQLKSLQYAARDGLLPGVEQGIAALLTDLPRVRDLISEVASELGKEAESAGKSLAGDDFENFLHYLETDGVPILHDTAHTIGNLAIAAANLMAAFGSTQTSFSGGLLDFSEKLADASKNLDKNAGFQEFLHYIEEVGPKAVDALESIANAALQIVEATAPLGGPALTALTALANVIAAIADSDLGTPIFAGIAALAAYNRGLQLTAKLQKGVAAFSPWTLAVVAGTAAVVEFTSANDDLEGSLQSIDAARATGDVNAYADSITAAQKSLDDFRAKQTEGHNPLIDNLPFGVGGLTHLDQISSWYHEFNGDNDEAQKKIDAARKSLQSFADGSVVSPINAISNAISDAAQAAEDEAQALQDATDAMREHRQEALRGVNAALDYQQAIDDARKALKDNGKTVDETTEKGRDNLRALYQLAGAWNDQSNAAKNAKGSLDKAQKGFIETATAMGMPIQKAKDLASRLFEIPPKRKTQIELNGADDAISKVKTLSDYIAALHGKSITIALNYQTGANKRPDIPLPGGSADGGSVPKDGGPYSDRFMYLLAPGEEVISNRHGEADRYRARIKGRYADGGTTGGGGFTLSANPAQGGPGFEVFNLGVYSVAKALKAFKAELEAASKSVDKEKQKRDDLIAAESSFMQAVGGAYAKADIFGGGLDTFDIGLQANTADTQAAQAALAAAAAHGLNGPLYQALAQSGNLMLLQQFAGLSEAEIAQREQAFAAQSNAQSTLGASAANAAGFTQAIKDQTKELKEAQQERKHLAAVVKSLEERLPGKVEDGARKGIAERDKRTHQRVRAGS